MGIMISGDHRLALLAVHTSVEFLIEHLCVRYLYVFRQTGPARVRRELIKFGTKLYLLDYYLSFDNNFILSIFGIYASLM